MMVSPKPGPAGAFSPGRAIRQSFQELEEQLRKSLMVEKSRPDRFFEDDDVEEDCSWGGRGLPADCRGCDDFSSWAGDLSHSGGAGDSSHRVPLGAALAGLRAPPAPAFFEKEEARLTGSGGSGIWCSQRGSFCQPVIDQRFESTIQTTNEILDEGPAGQGTREARPNVIGDLGRQLRRAGAPVFRGEAPGRQSTAQSHRSGACLDARRDGVNEVRAAALAAHAAFRGADDAAARAAARGAGTQPRRST